MSISMLNRGPIRLLFMLASILTLLLMVANTARAADRDRLEAFLEITGFDVALDSMALSAGDAPAMLGFEASDFGSEWSRISKEVFDTENMRETALEILAATLSDDLLTHAAAFYASPLGQRLVEVENASHFDEDEEARNSIGGAVVNEGGDRVVFLNRMNDAIDGAGTAVKGIHELQIRFLLAASYAGVIENDIDEDVLRAFLKESEDDLRVALRASGLVSAAYTYRDLSDSDLEAYAVALEHPDMKEVYVLMNAVQYEIMAKRFEVLAGRMAELTPAQEL